MGVSQAQLDQAEAALASAELDLGYTTIYSPVNGIVVSRNADVGQTVAATFQTPILFVIAQDLTKMEVNANEASQRLAGSAKAHEQTFASTRIPNSSLKVRSRRSEMRRSAFRMWSRMTWSLRWTIAISSSNRA